MKASPLFLLFLVFLVLKLCDVIAWSWWWVTSPLWIPMGLGLVFMACCLAMALAAGLLGD